MARLRMPAARELAARQGERKRFIRALCRGKARVSCLQSGLAPADLPPPGRPRSAQGQPGHHGWQSVSGPQRTLATRPAAPMPTTRTAPAARTRPGNPDRAAPPRPPRPVTPTASSRVTARRRRRDGNVTGPGHHGGKSPGTPARSRRLAQGRQPPRWRPGTSRGTGRHRGSLRAGQPGPPHAQGRDKFLDMPGRHPRRRLRQRRVIAVRTRMLVRVTYRLDDSPRWVIVCRSCSDA